MARVRLEIDHLQIHRPKKRWKLYLLVATEHPTDKDKMVVSVLPQNPILVVPSQNNQVVFEDNSPGANGLFLLSREMPVNREVNVHVYTMHSRRSLNEIGKVLKDVENGLAGDAFGLLTDVLGTTAPWLAIARKALPVIGQILEKIPDRNMGFVTMFERFGPEFENEVEIDREARGGNISMIYSWAVEG
jgi:hypothetical protein